MPTATLATDPRPAPPPAWAKLASGLPTEWTWSHASGTSDLARFLWQGRDSMHARYYNPNIARFLSVDPVRGNAKQPQSWNAYAYVANRPMTYVDPDGRLFASWHFVTTLFAAHAQGFSWRQAFKLGWASVKVDFEKNSLKSKAASDTNKHGMIGEKPDGDRQTAAEAREIILQGVMSNAAKDTTTSVGTALHTIQDLSTPLHRDRVWTGQVTLTHTLGDWFPSLGTLRDASSTSQVVLQLVKQANDGTPVVLEDDSND